MAVPAGYAPLTANQIVETTIGLLLRDTILARTVTRQGFGDFRRSTNDTVTLHLPVYAEAGNRAMRGATTRTRQKLVRRPVDVALDRNIHLDVPLTDEEITLDVYDFGREVIAPAAGSIVRGLEQLTADTMRAATYNKSVPWNPEDPFGSLVDANMELNKASVPMTGRSCALGSVLYAQAVKADKLSKVNESGSTGALRDASVGNLAEFDDVFFSSYLGPYEGYAYHQSAFALPTVAPAVPAGVPWGASLDQDGFAVRVMQALDAADVDGPTNVVFNDVFAGCSEVMDYGTVDGYGVFIPSTAPDLSTHGDRVFVRAVKIGTPLSS